VITCISIDSCGLYAISGSRDTTVIIWELTGNKIDGSLNPKSVQVLYGHDKSVSCVAISIDLDMAVSGSQDGTINVHTIKDGQYMRTLRPSHDPGVYTVEHLTISYQGHVVFTGHTPSRHSLHVFTLNGRFLASCIVSHRITGLLTSEDRILTGDENGDLVMRDLYSLNVITEIPLQLPVQTLALTVGNSHILAPLRDGKVIVVGLAGIPENILEGI